MFWFEFRVSAAGAWKDSILYDTELEARKAAEQALENGDVIDVSDIHVAGPDGDAEYKASQGW